MNPESLKASLQTYQAFWEPKAKGPAARREDFSIVSRFLELLQKGEHAFLRNTLPGHFTASSYLFDPDSKMTLLTHHRKLDLWLQLGGHADGNPDLKAVALQEVEEESGLTEVRLLKGESEWVDLDIHRIPANSKDPEHWHYDVRFFGLASENSPLVRQDRESVALRWFSLPEAYEVANQESMHRVFDKFQSLL